jgi:hypothetical protein
MEKLKKLGQVHATITPDHTLTAQDMHGVIVDNKQVDKGRLYNETSPTLMSNDYKEPKLVIEALQSVYTDKDGCAYACNARYYKGPSYADVWKNRNTQIIEPKINVIGHLDMKNQEHAKRVYDPEGLAPTLTTSQGGNVHPKILEPQPPENRAVVTGYRVRRLTPIEYGRLQGFPMHRWNQVVSDSQAYKQFGNAVTVSKARYVAKTILTWLHAIKGTAEQEVAAGASQPATDLHGVVVKGDLLTRDNPQRQMGYSKETCFTFRSAVQHGVIVLDQDITEFKNAVLVAAYHLKNTQPELRQVLVEGIERVERILKAGNE